MTKVAKQKKKTSIFKPKYFESCNFGRLSTIANKCFYGWPDIEMFHAELVAMTTKRKKT